MLGSRATRCRDMVGCCLRPLACASIDLEGIRDGLAWAPDPSNRGTPGLFGVLMRPRPACSAVQAALAGE